MPKVLTQPIQLDAQRQAELQRQAESQRQAAAKSREQVEKQLRAHIERAAESHFDARRFSTRQIDAVGGDVGHIDLGVSIKSRVVELSHSQVIEHSERLSRQQEMSRGRAYDHQNMQQRATAHLDSMDHTHEVVQQNTKQVADSYHQAADSVLTRENMAQINKALEGVESQDNRKWITKRTFQFAIEEHMKGNQEPDIDFIVQRERTRRQMIDEAIHIKTGGAEGSTARYMKERYENAAGLAFTQGNTDVVDATLQKLPGTKEAKLKLQAHIDRLALEQQFDNPEQYVSHGFDHSANVTRNIADIAKQNPELQDSMQKKYGLDEKESQAMLEMVGIFHDFGYSHTGNRGKAVHAVTGAQIAASPETRAALDACLQRPPGRPQLLDAQLAAVSHDFSKAVLFHSADKVEESYDAKVVHGHAEFLVKKENLVEVFTSFKMDDAQQQTRIVAGKEQAELIRRTLAENNISLEATNTTIVEPSAGEQIDEGGRFRGRSVDLDAKQDRKMGIEFKPVDATEDPMSFAVRLADNLDMTRERFSQMQSTPAFKAIYHRIGPLEGNPEGHVIKHIELMSFNHNKISNPKSYGLGEEQVKILEAQNTQMMGIFDSPEGKSMIDDLSKRDSSIRELADKRDPRRMDVLQSHITQAIVDQEIERNPTTSDGRTLSTEERAKLSSIALSVNGSSVRHFGGCEPVKKVELTGSQLKVTVDRETFEDLNRTKVVEEGKWVGIGEYQIYRAEEAFQSLKFNGREIEIIVQDQSGKTIVPSYRQGEQSSSEI